MPQRLKLPAVLALLCGAFLSLGYSVWNFYADSDDPAGSPGIGGPLHEPVMAETAVPADAADGIADDELVLGVVIDDEARAWPIRYLQMSSEHVNDTVGETPLVATW